jgi:hypothetical protein
VRANRVSLLLLCALALLALPSASLAKDPPNPNDPCSVDGRDTCGTTGVGFYSQSPYGIRWFGDYRRAVPDQVQTFCLDLGYWYPSPSYRFREVASTGLKNRENETVPLGNLQRIAYAIWADGRTNDQKRQAAVMLYVHSLMGDARPREVDPAAVNAALVPLVEQVARDASRYHGPYRIDAHLPGGLAAGKQVTATVRVLSAAGAPLPDLQLDVAAEGASVSTGARTNASGVATVALTPTGAGAVKLTLRATTASTLPKVFAPTTPAAAQNGQRLAAPDSQVVTDTFTASVVKAHIGVASTATPTAVAVGQPSRDRVTITGPLRDTVSWRAFGPFPSTGAIRCDGTPAAKGSFDATGPGAYMTAAATFDKPGWYVYKETIAETAAHIGVSTPCTDARERVRVEAQPRVRSIVSSDRVDPGTAVHDRVLVDGLAGQSATVQAALYGPYPAADAIDCAGKPIWTGSIAVPKDGEYATDPFTLKAPGFYVYRESIAAQGFVRAVQTACADQAETTVAVAHPKITTRVSAQKTRPGATIFDRVVVTGLGALNAPVRVSLWGPFATRGGIACSGTPYWSGSFVAKGDGTYTTPPVKLRRAGFYVYQESITQGPASAAFTAPCADVTETTFASAQPRVVTLASAEVVLPGSRLSDRIRVSGLGSTSAAIDVALFGPFASRSAIRCTGRPFWQTRVYARGDRELRSPAVRVTKVGFYTFRERVVRSGLVAESTTDCALDLETALARPLIITGRGDTTRYVAAAASGALTPTRVRLGSLGIDAPISPAGIDVPHGILGVSPNIDRTAWWADGSAPGARTGAILIAGHVDSASAGAGAFFRLHEARAGQRVEVVTAGGRTLAYRVVSVRVYPKRDLPPGVYSRRGSPRLVLVTCGGPFDESTRHYRDNVVVTAVPV